VSLTCRLRNESVESRVLGPDEPELEQWSIGELLYIAMQDVRTNPGVHSTEWVSTSSATALLLRITDGDQFFGIATAIIICFAIGEETTGSHRCDASNSPR